MIVTLFHSHDAVFTDGDGHTVFDIVQEFLTQAVHHGHLHVRQPHGGQNGTGGSQRVDGIGKQHTGRLAAQACADLFGIGPTESAAVCAAVLAAVGMLVLYRTSTPFDRFRAIIFAAMAVALVGSFTLLGSPLDFSIQKNLLL